MYNFDELLENTLGDALDRFGRYLAEQESNTLSVEEAIEAFYRCASYGMDDIYPSDSVDITDLI